MYKFTVFELWTYFQHEVFPVFLVPCPLLILFYGRKQYKDTLYLLELMFYSTLTVDLYSYKYGIS